MELTDLINVTERRLHEDAADRTKLDDFGSDDYLTGLRRLLAAVATDIDSSVLNSCDFHAWILRPLVARLHAVAAWKAAPDTLNHPIESPVIIVGVPRSGTTALHHMLALNKSFQGVESWLTRTPMIRPPRAAWRSTPQYLAAVAAHEVRSKSSPALVTSHLTGPDEVDECLPLMAQTFLCNAFGSRAKLPSYDAWWRNHDNGPAYRWLSDCLRLIGAREDKRWLLKNPSHVLHIETLDREFPDAKIIQIHRDPLQTLPSLCHLLAAERFMRDGDPIDRDYIAAREVELWADGVIRLANFTNQNPNKVLHLEQSDFRLDPVSASRRIHAFIGEEFDRETEERTREWGERQSQSHSSKAPRHNLEALSLSREVICRRFADYRESRGYDKEDEEAPV